MVTKIQQRILTDIINNARNGIPIAFISIELIKKNAVDNPTARECLEWMREYVRAHPSSEGPVPLTEVSDGH